MHGQQKSGTPQRAGAPQPAQCGWCMPPCLAARRRAAYKLIPAQFTPAPAPRSLTSSRPVFSILPPSHRITIIISLRGLTSALQSRRIRLQINRNNYAPCDHYWRTIFRAFPPSTAARSSVAWTSPKRVRSDHTSPQRTASHLSGALPSLH